MTKPNEPAKPRAWAIDDEWLTFSPHSRKSPDRAVRQLVLRYSKTAVQKSLDACEAKKGYWLDDDWWLLAIIREFGRRGFPEKKWMTEEEIRGSIGLQYPEHASANDRKLRRRFAADRQLRLKLILLSVFVELWGQMNVEQRRWAVEEARKLAITLDDKMVGYIAGADILPDPYYVDRPPSNGLKPDKLETALHQPYTLIIRDWLGRLVFP